jgi:hypothetical protein
VTSPVNTKQKFVIPQPTNDLEGMYASVLAMKECLEVLMSQRGHSDDHAVTWGDLIRLDLVPAGFEPEGIPRGAQRLAGRRGS